MPGQHGTAGRGSTARHGGARAGARAGRVTPSFGDRDEERRRPRCPATDRAGCQRDRPGTTHVGRWRGLVLRARPRTPAGGTAGNRRLRDAGAHYSRGWPCRGGAVRCEAHSHPLGDDLHGPAPLRIRRPSRRRTRQGVPCPRFGVRHRRHAPPRDVLPRHLPACMAQPASAPSKVTSTMPPRSPRPPGLSRRECRQPPIARDQRSWMTDHFRSNSASHIRLVKAPGIVSERPRTRTTRTSHQDPLRVRC